MSNHSAADSVLLVFQLKVFLTKKVSEWMSFICLISVFGNSTRLCSQKNILRLIMLLYDFFKCCSVIQALNECFSFICTFLERRLSQNGIFQAVRFDSEWETCNEMTRKQHLLLCYNSLCPLLTPLEEAENIALHTASNHNAADKVIWAAKAIWSPCTVALKVP